MNNIEALLEILTELPDDWSEVMKCGHIARYREKAANELLALQEQLKQAESIISYVYDNCDFGHGLSNECAIWIKNRGE